MPCFDRTQLPAMVPLLARCAAAVCVAAACAGCGSDGPGTSVRVALAYDDSLGLDTAEVTLDNRTESAAIAHELLLLVSDDVAGREMPIEVWGRKDDQRVAYGTTTAVPERGKTVSAQLSLTCMPGCQGDMLRTCTGPLVDCALGCSETGDAHCISAGTSNGIDPMLAAPLTGTTTVTANAILDTDTGEITGAISRPAGTGINGGIGYFQAPAFGPGGAALGIFAFHNLAVEASGSLRFTGSRAAVVLVGDTAGIAGTIDVAASRGTRSTPGPGGGAGGTVGPAGGCGAGGSGGRDGGDDGGGGGGGGGENGAAGGGLTPALPGIGGGSCLPGLLEPLQGGSGGGTGGPGSQSMPASGGGGGGGLQITAVRALVVTGTINAGGGGGAGAAAALADAGGGGGGGSGGALLLEAPTLTIAGTAVLAANGGGGGGGGGTQPGLAGSNGRADNVAAEGGGGSDGENGGGSGGATGSAADLGRDGTTNGNAGGGGGGVGRIVLRGRIRVVGGLISPPPTQTDLKPPM
jgi:hypothetical protein